MAEPFGTIAKYRRMGQIEKHNEQVRAWAAPMALDVAAIFWATYRGIESRMPQGDITTDEEKFKALTTIDTITREEVAKQTPNLWACLAEYERKVFIAGAVELCRRMGNFNFLVAREPLKEARATEVNLTEATLSVSVDDDGWVNVPNQRAVDYATDHAAEMVTEIDETTREAIHKIIVDATASGTSYDDIANFIKSKFEDFSIPMPQNHIENRATLVAVTELANAYCEGNMQTGQFLEDAGLDMMKIWSTCEDERVSEGCRANQAAGWIRFDEAFPSGDQHPPRFPGCRCDVLQEMLEEAALGKSYDEFLDMDFDDESVADVGNYESGNFFESKKNAEAVFDGIKNRYDRFQYVVDRMGADGLPTVIKESDLREGETLYRGLMAMDEDELEQYKDQFINGEWYNSCGGGALYDYGTYTSLDQSVAKTYTSPKGCSFVERIQLKENAKMLDASQRKNETLQLMERENPGCFRGYYDYMTEKNPRIKSSYPTYESWIKSENASLEMGNIDFNTLAVASGYDAVYYDDSQEVVVIVNRTAVEVVR